MDTLQYLKDTHAPIEIWYILVIGMGFLMSLLITLLIYLVKRFFERMEQTLETLTDMVNLHDTEIKLLKQAQAKRRS